MPNRINLPVFLSLSLPKELIGTNQAQDLYDFLASIVKAIAISGGNIVFGGHPTITPLIHKMVISLGVSYPCIHLFQLERFKNDAPPEIGDERVFQLTWYKDHASIDIALGNMRAVMARQAQAAVFLGGNRKSITHTPGIKDEYSKFISYHPKGPAYLLGFLGGTTTEIISDIEKQGISEPNGLNEKEANIIHHSTNIDLITSLILADLAKTTRCP
ncbi:MAG: hypothetical protein WAQ98_09645 [Blastocatellia bacterium]